MTPSRATAGTAAWHLVTGTARGRSHIARNRPNEDAVAHRQVPAIGGIVVAIGDGHGHDRHFRSATGSAFAVQVACQVADDLATEPGRFRRRPAPAESILDKLPSAVLSSWRAEVARHVRAHPFTEQEQSALDVDGDGPEVPYGSTLLVAVITANWLVCAQIGDGDMVAVKPDGGYCSPVPGDAALDGLRTTSLCQPTALESFRVGLRDLVAEPLAALLLATDGYGNAQAADPWQPDWACDMAELAAGRDPEWFAKQVPGWAELCASGEGSGDDTTIALLLADRGAGMWTR
jgi:hypothetical protein